MGVDDASLSGPGDRAGRTERVVTRTLARRAAGEHVPDAAVLAEHPELWPELAVALRAAADIGRAARDAARPGDAGSDAVHVLSDEELDAPIDADGGDATDGAEPPVATAVPRFDGYEVVGLLPRGGQGVVYRAVQAATGRAVAIKVLTGGRYAPAKARRRFDREARVLAALDHPNLVSVLDAGTAGDGSPFIVMPYVDGPPLDQWLASTQDLAEVLRLFERLARAVHAAHAAGVVHRDLKPSNIRVDANAEPRVLDFGLARLSGEHPPSSSSAVSTALTLDRQLLGSIAWMSPEQAAGAAEAVDGRSDGYALGVMLYEATAGRPPYPPGSIAATLGHVLATVPPAPSRSAAARRGVGRRVDAIVLKCLSKDPAGRYGTAALLADDLARCRAGQRPWATLARPVIPNRWWRLLLAGSVAAVTVVGVVVEAVALFGGPRLPPRPATARPTTRPLPTLIDELGNRYVRIPAGHFTTVDPQTGRPRTIGVDRPFWIGTREVTRRTFASAPAPQPAGPPRPSSPNGIGDVDAAQTDVSRAAAVDFCRRWSRRMGRPVRLPTEAEWELAARGGADAADGARRFGVSADPAATAWTAANSNGHAHPVGRQSPNPFGLFDANGNVAEWCAGPDPVARGGSYADAPAACANGPRRQVPDGRGEPTVGFRMVVDDPSAAAVRHGATSKPVPDPQAR